MRQILDTPPPALREVEGGKDWLQRCWPYQSGNDWPGLFLPFRTLISNSLIDGELVAFDEKAKIPVLGRDSAS